MTSSVKKSKTREAAPHDLDARALPGFAAVATIVFGAGALVMMLELVGSRLLAPFFGNSLFVWTSLIGVMLGFLSLGYYLGGRFADSHLGARYLFWILVGSAIAVALIAVTENFVLPLLARGGGIRLSAVVAATIMFALPSTMLGMVSPYCIRLRMHVVEDSGRTVGSLTALSTLGSIAGTFAAGFWLISVFGTRHLVMLIAGALALLSLLVVGWRFDWRRIAALALLIGMLAYAQVARGAETIDTQYDRYSIRRIVDPVSGRPLIGLSRDQRSAESVSYEDNGQPYRFEYYRYYDLAPVLGGKVDKALLIGGGTFSYPRLFAAENPTATMDVVEIDPALYGIAKRDFGFKDDPRLHLYFEDGRTFLNHASGRYDAVFMDAFKSQETVPYQLTSKESWQHISDLMSPDGVLVMNVIASPDDDRAPFFNALYATISQVFPHVAAFKVEDVADSRGIRNTAIVAIKDPKGDIKATLAAKAPEFAARMYSGYTPPAGTPVLTDDFAPVDQYLLGF